MKKAIFTQHSETHFSAKVGYDHFLAVEYDIRGVWTFDDIWSGQAGNKFSGVAGYVIEHIKSLGYEHNLTFENKMISTEVRYSDELGNERRRIQPELKACIIIAKEESK